MAKAVIHGKVEGGRFVADYPHLFKSAFEQFNGKVVTVTVGEFKKPRSLSQNAYLHGVVYSIIADETGHTIEEIAEVLKQMFLRPRIVLGVPVMGTTTELSTLEFNEYVEKIKAWAAGYGINVPEPNEVEI